MSTTSSTIKIPTTELNRRRNRQQKRDEDLINPGPGQKFSFLYLTSAFRALTTLHAVPGTLINVAAVGMYALYLDPRR